MKRIENISFSQWQIPLRMCAFGLFLFLCLQASFAQAVKAKARVDSLSILIGNPFHLDLTIEQEAGWEVQLPLWVEKLGEFDILAVAEPDSVKEGETLRIHHQLTLTAYDSGYFDVPAVSVAYHRPGDTAISEVKTNAIPVTVLTIPVDTTSSLRPIKEPLDAPVSFREVLPYLVIVALVASIAFGLWWYRRYLNNRPVEIIKRVKPTIPAHIIAGQRFRQLKEEKLWQQGEFKAYYSELTNILREYLENRYDILALESTTDEIMVDIKGLDIDAASQVALIKLLSFADLVKFAKYTPLADDCQKGFAEAENFVAQTQPKAPVENAEAEPVSPKNQEAS